ncbi:flagellar motor protein MotB [Nocardioides daejeonensis]|uniref:flagellar motor protein MotB n=1 Tax=Nocardioides daejeonensis TaxID=1046556 RepID=UPI000D74B1F8|nr:flagellar motor protein MotB [Nocardioides daejeonensis]
MARRQVEEEHENHERWLVSYADMITVLMALFIVLYAMSQVDETKYEELKQSLRAGFGQSGAMMHEQRSVLDGQGQTAMSAMRPEAEMSSLTPEQVRIVDRAITRKEQLAQEQRAAEVDREVSRLQEVLSRLKKALEKRGLQDDVRASIDDRGLVVSLVSRHVVFDANLASLTERGRAVIDTLAPVLRDLPDALQIDGHTNQVKVKPKFFASDWDLSAARAITVLRHLNEVGRIPADRLSATAYGMERPLVDPTEPGSQRINKRVDIVVLTSLPPESRELLSEYGFDRDGTVRGETS